MNYQKIDPILLSNIENSKNPQQEKFGVFIRVNSPLSKSEHAILKSIGVPLQEGEDRRVYIAHLSYKDIEMLSEQNWVLRISGDVKFDPM